ncbi:MAG: hypothetical protein COX81_00685 [Candidatus Magasanikbacteria bacterium CG_4_10_14_0_2_um_filter_37_12]|uniref:Uncharacterized protein n=1 Tax=Candidatus Magasanikbacteria bacterium CG_4_10_14_0_2_um_filter_37_12 TaxID=1974637 RepID=A0A2M7V9P6_9BACT|nr:MAG: hypothetical protein COX81_00685 [Candidatus Magasanikbacteria bacterium CG_4_10_14_0_2_um_filter_37_12]
MIDKREPAPLGVTREDQEPPKTEPFDMGLPPTADGLGIPDGRRAREVGSTPETTHALFALETYLLGPDMEALPPDLKVELLAAVRRKMGE